MIGNDSVVTIGDASRKWYVPLVSATQQLVSVWYALIIDSRQLKRVLFLQPIPNSIPSEPLC